MDNEEDNMYWLGNENATIIKTSTPPPLFPTLTQNRHHRSWNSHLPLDESSIKLLKKSLASKAAAKLYARF
jgi:hypothetical protein